MFTKLLHQLNNTPHLVQSISINQFFLFFDLCCQLRPLLEVLDPSPVSSLPPLSLPSTICRFLSGALSTPEDQIDIETIKLAWKTLSPSIWTMPERRAPDSLLPLFIKHGTPLSIGYFTVRPTTLTCSNPCCNMYGCPLKKISQYQATLFTHNYGPIPVFPISLQCPGCKTRYYSDHFVHNQSQSRTYYDFSTLPSILQVSQKAFIDGSLCELFANLMVFGWVSFTNCARIYNEASRERIQDQYSTFETRPVVLLDADHVQDAFIIHSLLLDSIRRGHLESLTVPHKDTHQRDRFLSAMQDRNHRYSSFGRPESNHACNLCTKEVVRDNGEAVLLRSAVTDGVTIGHPRCAVPDCKEPLPNMKAHHCLVHHELDLKCSTIGCQNLASSGHDSCAEPECRELERIYRSKGLAMFQLQQRLASQRQRNQEAELDITDPLLAATFPDSQRTISSDEAAALNDDDEVEVTVECEDRGTGQKRKRRARFGRLRTYCEVCCVMSCGTMIGRGTMFNSEAANGVIEFWHHLFPSIHSLPTFMWYDNNCTVKKVLQRVPDDRLNQIALPVDVFHFKSKHKESDEFCGQHCNPALWPELMTDGKWTFNSSAAEQSNAWMAQYLPIVREMRPAFFNFYLDEMIRRHNNWNISQLAKRGHNPRYILNELLYPHLFGPRKPS